MMLMYFVTGAFCFLLSCAQNILLLMLNTIEVTGKKDTRSGFGDGILEAARLNENIVALTADLAGSLKLGGFIKEFPERYFQCGIAEANMMGIAAGLTIGGRRREIGKR